MTVKAACESPTMTGKLDQTINTTTKKKPKKEKNQKIDRGNPFVGRD